MNNRVVYTQQPRIVLTPGTLVSDSSNKNMQEKIV